MSTPSIAGTAGPQRAEARPAAIAVPDARWSRRVAIDVIGLGDVAAVVAGLALAATLHVRDAGPALKAMQLLQAGLVAALVVHICLRSAGHYRTDRLHALPAQPLVLLTCLAVAWLAGLGLGLPSAVSNGQFAIASATWIAASFALMLANRLVGARILSRATRDGRFDTRVAVFGAGAVARRVHDHLAADLGGIRFVGVYDDRLADERLNAEGLRVSGRLDDLVAAARDGAIDAIVIALPAQADGRIAAVARRLEHLPVSLHVVTHLASDLVGEGPAHRVSSLGAVGLLDVKRRPLADWAPIVKRTEDLVVAGLLLAAALPVMALIAFAVRLESPGPVLFAQRRRGLNGRIFQVLKFRTMTVMEDGANLSQARAIDHRVTRVGWLLRRSSLDELPQLWNVMRGEMSLVGPRPHALVHDDQWGEMLERYANRHQVKPGLTGLAQVRGWRGEADSIDKIEHRVAGDLEYIANWSLWLDLSILARTVWVVLSARNAH
ncbi:MAG: undecaprenyl-phosphate glucose phosphotransferase [Hyphomicrobiaceae bacterium]